ncbi:MAG: NUDIX hydrolase [Deltaproteobacteria bacterium]|nr:NUDIX hydrolase [Deltaproteobacteria bacterium]
MSDATYPDLPRAAVGAVVVKNGNVLLVKRKAEPDKNLWAIPGGKIKLGETLQDAAQREVLEETGVSIKVLGPIFAFDVIERDTVGNVRFHYVIVDFLAEYIGGEPAASDDASEARFFSSDECKKIPLSPNTKLFLDAIQFI